jgi:predicted RND superfamily exporter protein
MLIAQESMVEVIDEQNLSSTSMIVIGMDITSREILNATVDSFSILLPAAFLLVIVVLGLVYRNVLDMVISLLALGFAIVWTYGIGTLAGFVFNPMTLAVPVVIAGLGIDYGIHLTLRYREEKSSGQSPRDSARTSVSWVGSALLIATITTLAAFAANLTSEMAALRDFGILLGVGIASAFVIMVTFVPSIRQILDGRSAKTPAETVPARRRKYLNAVNALGAGATAAEHHPRIIVVATLLVTALALAGAVQLETRFELIDFLPDSLEYAREIKFVLEGFNATMGTAQANILVQGDLTSPSVLKAIETATLNMVDDELVAMKATPVGDRPDVSSILSLMEDVATDESLTDPLDLYDEEFEDLYRSTLVDDDEVPDEEIEALLTWLYTSNMTSGTTRSLLHRSTDGVFDYTVIRIAITSDDFETADTLLTELEADATPLDGLTGTGELEQATVTGSTIMIKQIIDSLQDSLTTSFIFTLIVSLSILTIVFFITERSVVLGAITMIPVLLSSAWILGTMYALDIPYTVMTVMITSLTVGLGVTYGIHLTHRFVEEMREHGNVDEGCMETVVHTGSALFGAAATTVAGFGLLVFSLLPPIQEFGAIVALTIIYSFLTTVFILPTFLVVWAKRTGKHKRTG